MDRFKYPCAEINLVITPVNGKIDKRELLYGIALAIVAFVFAPFMYPKLYAFHVAGLTLGVAISLLLEKRK